MKLKNLIPFYTRYAAAMSRICALETTVALMLEHARYRPSDSQGFNGQQHRKRIFRELIDCCHFQQIVETGTHLGDTTAFMATASSLRIDTCEANPTFHAIARNRLADFAGICFHQSDSRTCLKALRDGAAAHSGSNAPVFFYLDAHWYSDLPLLDELAIIVNGWKQFVVMVDDFHVPDDPGYRYDDYGPGKTLEPSILSDIVKKHDLSIFYPSLPGALESGARSGCVVVTRQGEMTDKLLRLGSLRHAATSPQGFTPSLDLSSPTARFHQ